MFFLNKMCLAQHAVCFNSTSWSNLSKVKCVIGIIYTWTFKKKTLICINVNIGYFICEISFIFVLLIKMNISLKSFTFINANCPLDIVSHRYLSYLCFVASNPFPRCLLVSQLRVDGPYNNVSTVNTSGSRGVYNKFHAHFYTNKVPQVVLQFLWTCTHLGGEGTNVPHE
jgi:hypothetical protein